MSSEATAMLHFVSASVPSVEKQQMPTYGGVKTPLNPHLLGYQTLMSSGSNKQRGHKPPVPQLLACGARVLLGPVVSAHWHPRLVLRGVTLE